MTMSYFTTTPPHRWAVHSFLSAAYEESKQTKTQFLYDRALDSYRKLLGDIKSQTNPEHRTVAALLLDRFNEKVCPPSPSIFWRGCNGSLLSSCKILLSANASATRPQVVRWAPVTVLVVPPGPRSSAWCLFSDPVAPPRPQIICLVSVLRPGRMSVVRCLFVSMCVHLLTFFLGPRLGSSPRPAVGPGTRFHGM